MTPSRLVLSCLAAVCLALPAPAWAHDDLDVQIQRISAAIAADPGDAGLYLRRAELFRQHAEFDNARADLATAALIDPRVAGLERQRARVQLDLGDHAGARLALDRHLAATPDDGEALAARAECAQRLDDVAAAQADLAAALALLHQPDPDLACRLAALLHRSGRTDEALACLARAGGVPALEEAALAIERAAGRHEAALARLDRLVAAGPAAQWLAERGDLLRSLGREVEARAAYEAAVVALAALPDSRRATAAADALATRLATALDPSSPGTDR